MSAPLPRVRFAPSPTGYLHIGGARTALFNWLYARRARAEGKGTFVLRIEDTDRERSTEASVQAIFEGMKWMGLDWDEGPLVGGPHEPYFQTQRLATYEKHAERLIAAKKAYRCDCKKADLDVLREQAQKEKRGFKYPGICREKNLPKGTPGAIIRFRMPDEGETTFDDLVKGPITTSHKEMQDEVIVRADGVPLYNFGAVVDDLEMGITMVARGDDHVVNTPRQILMYQALDYPVPVFAHLPMILGADKQRLSKRHGAVSVLQYRDDGYLPGALVNYLARLGWSHGDQEIFSLAELIEKFDWKAVGATAGVFNPDKLLWLNQQWIKATPLPELAKLVRPYLVTRSALIGPTRTFDYASLTDARIVEVLPQALERSKTLIEMADLLLMFLCSGVAFDEASAKKHLTADAKPLLVAARDLFEQKMADGPHALEAAFRDLATAQSLGLGKIAQPVRVAVTGSTVSPPLFDTIVLLGKAEAMKRLDAAIARIG
ncbi:MAG: glutamate--tRNA ligase [Deltaproteobacteria bacterium]|nr:glutamate--tRNA ligase [Deltaproteobacteria bacterium]